MNSVRRTWNFWTGSGVNIHKRRKRGEGREMSPGASGKLRVRRLKDIRDIPKRDRTDIL